MENQQAAKRLQCRFGNSTKTIMCKSPVEPVRHVYKRDTTGDHFQTIVVHYNRTCKPSPWVLLYSSLKQPCDLSFGTGNTHRSTDRSTVVKYRKLKLPKRKRRWDRSHWIIYKKNIIDRSIEIDTYSAKEKAHLLDHPVSTMKWSKWGDDMEGTMKDKNVHE